MIRRFIDPPAERPDIKTTVIVEYRAILTGDMEALGVAADELDKMFKRFFETTGVSVVSSSGSMRHPSKDEMLALIPRKWHLEVDDHQLCATPYVAKRYLTKDPSKVTCKLCLKKTVIGV